MEWETTQTDLVRDTDYALTGNGFQPLFQGTKTLTVDESKFPTGAFKITVDWRDTLPSPSHEFSIGTGSNRRQDGGFEFGAMGNALYCWIYNSNNDLVKMINAGSLYHLDDVSTRTQGYRDILKWDGVDTIDIEHYEGGDYQTPDSIYTYTLTPGELAMNPFTYTTKEHFNLTINSMNNDGGSPPIVTARDGIEISTLKIEDL